MTQQTDKTQTVTIQQEQRQDPIVIDLTDGVSFTEFLLVVLVLTTFLSKVSSVFSTGQKIYNSIIYINKDELLLRVEIQKLCDQLLAITYAQRVLIGLFHNGTQDNMGFHEKKMSVLVESHNDTTQPVRGALQSVPIDKMAAEILSSDTKNYKTVVRGSTDTPCDLQMDSIGITRKDYRTFCGTKKEIYGIINIHYSKEPAQHFLTDPARVKQVNKITRRIEHILERIKSPDTPKWRRFIGGLVKEFTGQ